MPTERRRIIFSDGEVVSAALSYCRTTGIPVPDAEIERHSIDTEKTMGLVLIFAVSSPEQKDDVQLDADAVLSALIEFCRIQSIPLPKTATKRLERFEGAVSMVFDMKRERRSVKFTLAA